MIWRDGEETPEEGGEAAPEENTDPIQIERDAPRPATILKVAGELEERGGTILELFKEIESPLGRVVLPIYLRQDDRDFFVEVATGPWDDRKSDEALDKAAILRSSQHAGAELEILSGYPVPPEVEFYFGTSPAALLQLDLARLTPERPEACAGLFREVGSNHWDVDLDYEPGYLPLVQELLIAALEGSPPAAQLLIYPTTDSLTHYASKELFDEGFFLSRADCDTFYRHYTGGTGCGLRGSRLLTQLNCGVLTAGSCTIVRWTSMPSCSSL